MMQVPFLRDLLRTDSIYISNNITFDNLAPLSSWLGKLGDPDLGGLPMEEFKRRQSLHHEAEVKAVGDTVEFIRKASDIYGYDHFLNDVSGSLCELDDPELFRMLAEHTVILYLQADKDDEEFLIERAASHPKPLYYREEFLDEQIRHYMDEKGIEFVALIDPDDFVRWVFPKLFYARVPRYEKIAREYGYAVPARAALEVSTRDDFLDLVEQALGSTS